MKFRICTKPNKKTSAIRKIQTTTLIIRKTQAKTPAFIPRNQGDSSYEPTGRATNNQGREQCHPICQTQRTTPMRRRLCHPKPKFQSQNSLTEDSNINSSKTQVKTQATKETLQRNPLPITPPIRKRQVKTQQEIQPQ